MALHTIGPWVAHYRHLLRNKNVLAGAYAVRMGAVAGGGRR